VVRSVYMWDMAAVSRAKTTNCKAVKRRSSVTQLRRKKMGKTAQVPAKVMTQLQSKESCVGLVREVGRGRGWQDRRKKK
jgi:hypothetical protein